MKSRRGLLIQASILISGIYFTTVIIVGHGDKSHSHVQHATSQRMFRRQGFCCSIWYLRSPFFHCFLLNSANLPFSASCSGNIPLYYFAPSTILKAPFRLSASFQTRLLVSTMGHKAQLSADVVTNVAFGLAGVFLTIFMICQAARYTASRNHYQRKLSTTSRSQFAC
jgi:hypothetical protein